MKNKDKDKDFVETIICNPLHPKFMPSPNELEKVDNDFTTSDLDESAEEEKKTVRPYKLPELFGTPDWDKCLVDIDKIKPSGKYIPEDLDLSDVPDINSAEWDHMYDDLPEEDEDEPEK